MRTWEDHNCPQFPIGIILYFTIMNITSKINPMLDSFTVFGNWPKNQPKKLKDILFHTEVLQWEHQGSCNSP